MIRNEYGVKFARKGVYKGEEYIFTHRNPANDLLWGEDTPNGSHEKGRWVSNRSVRLL